MDEVVDELATLPAHKMVFLADDNLTLQPGTGHRNLSASKLKRGVRRRLVFRGRSPWRM